MSEPDTFGLSAVQTLSSVADPHRVPSFGGFWHAWRALVSGCEPRLTPTREPDPSDATGTHTFTSIRDVRIGCTLCEPKGPVRAGVVALHGYGTPEPLGREPARWSALTSRGVGVLAIRVRGYPGSQLDCGDLTTLDDHRGGWITRGLSSTEEGVDGALDWIVGAAAGDTANAVRALRDHLGAVPIYLHGESLGGALAVVAAAQSEPEWKPDRLSPGLVTLGDWNWRLQHTCGGSGGEIARLLVHHAARAGELTDRLRLLDTARHAAAISMPVLCKIALRDDVVPAPTQAAVYNAFGTDPGRKWRFVTPFGHFEGGLHNARRHLMFDRALADFFDPSREPEDSMSKWEDLLITGDPPTESTPESGGQPSLFGESLDAADSALCAVYKRIGRTLDDLPYTEEFDTLFAEVGGQTPREVFRRLHNMRKAGKLPKLGKAEGSPIKLDPHEETALADLVVQYAGSLGQRDRLLYTPDFDQIVEKLNASTGRSLDHHAVWRLMAKIAK